MPLTHRVGAQAMHRMATVNNGRTRNIFVGQASISNKNGIPSGHLPPSSWVMPQVGGGMSAFTGTYIVVDTPSAVLAGGRNMVGDASIVFSTTPPVLQLIAGLTGTTSITFSVPDATLGGVSYLSGTTTITFTPSAPILGGIANLTATTTIITGSSATIYAKGFMAGPAPDQTITPAAVASAVWSEGMASGYSAAQLMELLAAVAAGKTDISNLGGGAALIKFRDLADSKDAVTAGMIGSKRDSVTLDID